MTEPETTALVLYQPTVTRDDMHRLLKYLEDAISAAVQPFLFEPVGRPDYLAITREVVDSSQEITPP